ncbi:MAG: HU family DNA-binding protein [Bacteroidales bacterium]|nr:HU family DNA-binding protein [Bacteroidales bacterium]
MSIQYIKIRQKYLIKGELKEKVRARIYRQAPMTLDELAQRVSHATTISRPDVIAVLSAMEEEISEAVLSGRPVKLSHLGTFSPSIKAKACDKEKDVLPSTIKGFSCNYAPSAYMKKRFMDVDYQLRRMPAADGAKKDKD